MYRDVLPDKGSLGGIYTALIKAAGEFVLVLACDMPFINSELLRFMIAQIQDDIDIIAPRVDGYPQGLHAIYKKNLHRSPSPEQLAADRLKIIRFYDQMRVTYLDEADYAAFDRYGRSFSNLNTPAELAQARRQLAKPSEARPGRRQAHELRIRFQRLTAVSNIPPRKQGTFNRPISMPAKRGLPCPLPRRPRRISLPAYLLQCGL